MAKFLLIVDDEESELYETLEEVQDSLETSELEDEVLDSAIVYKVTNAYQVERNGLELIETDL